MPWYHINLDGDQEGPFQFQELAERFQSKQIDIDTFVWHGKKVKEWSKIVDVPGLQQKLNRPIKPKDSRGSVVDLFTERKSSTRSRAGTVPDFARMASTESLGQGPGDTKNSQSLKEFRDSLKNTNQDDLIKQLWMHKRSSSLKQAPEANNSAVGERMVQIANLLVKTQDELERQKKENEIILNENREHKSKMAELESRLKKEVSSKQTLRKQWKKAQSEYESEIKQYQSQLDIFFAAETELNDLVMANVNIDTMQIDQDAFASSTPWLGTLGGIGGGQFGYAESVFSDDKSIQINLSYVE